MDFIFYAIIFSAGGFGFQQGYTLYGERKGYASERKKDRSIEFENYTVERNICIAVVVFVAVASFFQKVSGSWGDFLTITTAGAAGAYCIARGAWYEFINDYEKTQKANLPAEVVEVVPAPTPAPIPPPFEIPDKLRLEHTLVLGGSGAGKTQLLSSWIAKDLFKPCSIVVFDSQGDLINNILKVNFPRERIVLIDPTDVEHPVALSLFDFVGTASTDFEREKNFNSVVELLHFVLRSLDSDVTAKQELTLRMLIRLCLVIPDATIHTLREVLGDAGYKANAVHVDKLSSTAQAFFHEEYLSKGFSETRDQIARRVYSILENRSLERMFSSPKSKVNMGKVLDDGSVVLINTAKSFLKESGSAFFARFMTAVIMQAIQERNPNKDNVEVFMFIDEAAPVISEQTADILETARKYKLGLTLAFQSLGQIPSAIEHSIISNTAIKAVCGISAKDARALADDMRTKAEYLMQTEPLHFLIHLRGGRRAVDVPVEVGALNQLQRRNDMKVLLEENRAKFSHQFTEKNAGPTSSIPDDDIEAINKA